MTETKLNGKRAVLFNIPEDKQEYCLVFDINTICDAEDETGVNLLQAISAIGNPRAVLVTTRQLRGLLYGMLKAGHPGVNGGPSPVTLLDAGRLLSQDMKGVTDAFMVALGVNPTEEEDEPAPTADPQATDQDSAATPVQ